MTISRRLISCQFQGTKAANGPLRGLFSSCALHFRDASVSEAAGRGAGTVEAVKAELLDDA
jgi:hypothetical protein